MTIARILNGKGRNVVRVTPTAPISEVVVQLTEHRIGALLVLDVDVPRSDARSAQILGIVSERDVVHALARAHAAGDVLDMTASQIMTQVRYTIAPSASLADAAVLMTEHRVRHLPVLENDILIGMVSIGDVVKARLEQQASEVDSLKAYVGGAH